MTLDCQAVEAYLADISAVESVAVACSASLGACGARPYNWGKNSFTPWPLKSHPVHWPRWRGGSSGWLDENTAGTDWNAAAARLNNSSRRCVQLATPPRWFWMARGQPRAMLQPTMCCGA